MPPEQQLSRTRLVCRHRSKTHRAETLAEMHVPNCPHPGDEKTRVANKHTRPSLHSCCRMKRLVEYFISWSGVLVTHPF
jgi:hypothetical protein